MIDLLAMPGPTLGKSGHMREVMTLDVAYLAKTACFAICHDQAGRILAEPRLLTPSTAFSCAACLEGK